jgi:hypothetical protein
VNGDPDKTRRKHDLYMESPNSLRPRKARQVKVNVKTMLIICFDFKGIVKKKVCPDSPNSEFHILL